MLLRSSKRVTLARRDTAIVIEGFPRSGNTYSVAAFVVANGPEPHVARHLHGPAHVLRAVRMGLPTVVLVRRPADAVCSYLVRRPTLTPADALVEYLDFYRTAWPARHGFVVGMFDQATTDFAAITDAVNRRFGTSFAAYRDTEEERAAAFALVEEMNRLECGGELVETHVGRPSAAREAARQEVRERLQQPRERRLLRQGNDLFDRYVALAADVTADPATARTR